MTVDLESQLRSALHEEARETARVDVGSLAGRVLIRGRRARRRRAIGAATAAVLVVGAIVAVPTWTSGHDRPTRVHVATQAPSPSAASATSVPSESATRALEPSKEEVQAWLDSLPELPEVPKITGDPSSVLKTVHGEAFTGAEDWEAVVKLISTGQVLAEGNPHGAALDASGNRLAVATDVLKPDGRPALRITLAVFAAGTGAPLAQISGLVRGTSVVGWLGDRVVLNVRGSDTGADMVALWDPATPKVAPVAIAPGQVLDVAESGHRILIEEPGGACVRVWQIVDDPQPVIEDCALARLRAISDDGQLAFVTPRLGSGPTVLDLRTGVQTAVQVPWPWVGPTRWSNDDRLVMYILVEPDEESPVVVCEPATGSCSRVRVLPNP